MTSSKRLYAAGTYLRLLARAWAVDRRLFSEFVTPAQEELLNGARITITGDQDTRDADNLPFEQDPDNKPIRDGERCYGLALTIEQQRKSGAPIVTAKVPPSGELTDNLRQRKLIITVRSAVFTSECVLTTMFTGRHRVRRGHFRGHDATRNVRYLQGLRQRRRHAVYWFAEELSVPCRAAQLRVGEARRL